MEKLLPCPFCGEANVYMEPRDRDQFAIIQCSNSVCRASMCISSETSGIKAWNTRASQWQTIESAPRDGTWILIFQKRENGNHARYVREARWSESKNSWGSATALNSVTHWMPLPEHSSLPAPPEVV